MEPFQFNEVELRFDCKPLTIKCFFMYLQKKKKEQNTLLFTSI